MANGIPSSADALLASAAPRGRAFFRLVRSLLDDLEQSAPWRLLYAPPADAAELKQRLTRLLELVDQAPHRVADELARLNHDSVSHEETEALREAEFYFTALHQMVIPDIHRLGHALEQMPGGAELPPAKADFYCELASDLKGKYSSAIMGAAAALASEGRWVGFEVEALLFPEKAEEGERNDRLLAALRSAVASIEEAIGNFAWREVLSSWRRRHSVDRYALAELVALRGHLLRLLTSTNRRALYSGDYHQLQGREILLGSRLRELETLHLRSLDVAPSTQTETAAEIYTRLHQLLLEVAALLDVEALRDLVGDELIQDLRARSPTESKREGSAARLDALSLLLVDEDLKMFLKLLVGAVKKRSSIAMRDAGSLSARSVAALLAVPESAQPAAESALPAAESARPERRAAPRLEPPPATPIDPTVRRRYAARLAGALDRLTGTDNAAWKSFLMLQKLQSRLRVVPPALMAEMSPFLSELERDLLPILDEARSAGAVPSVAVDTLRACHGRLSSLDLTRPESALAMGGDLARVTRMLESLANEGRVGLAAPAG